MKRASTFFLATLLSVGAAAHDFRTGAIVVDHPYGVAGGNSVYFRALRNTGAADDRLLGASSPEAGRVDLLHGGRPDTLALPAGAELPFRHDGAWQLALPGLKAALRPGETVHVTLRFEHAPSVTVPAFVVDPSQRHAH